MHGGDVEELDMEARLPATGSSRRGQLARNHAKASALF
jgi:hypothetical protein